MDYNLNLALVHIHAVAKGLKRFAPAGSPLDVGLSDIVNAASNSRAALSQPAAREGVSCQHESWNQMHGYRQCADCGERWTAATPSQAAPDTTAALVETLEGVSRWFRSIQDIQWDDIVADGGVTAWMVIQQEARTVQRPRIKRALAAHSQRPQPASEIRDDVECICVGQHGPNPECGQCGGSGCYATIVSRPQPASDEVTK